MKTLRATKPLLAALLLLVAAAGSSLAAPPPPSPTALVATRFYDAFVKGDVVTMNELYDPQVKFKDEIFSFSDRAGTMGMWRLLVDPKGGGKFSYKLLEVHGDTATVQWLADYTFPPGTSFGRPVHNVVTATLVIRDGKIVDHHDSFSWEKWTKQALPLGKVPTWKPVEALIKFTMRTFLGYKAKQLPPLEAPRPSTKGIIDQLPTK